MHVATTRRHYTDKSGTTKVYEAHLLRRSYRQDGKVKTQTVGNLSALPAEAIEAVRSVLKGEVLTAVGAPSSAVQVSRSVPHGHVAAVLAQARALGLPALLGPPGRVRDLALALIVARVVRPASKLATTRWWADTTLTDLGVGDACTDEVYAALDWLAGRQPDIEALLAQRHLAPANNPGRAALYDLSSSWVTGRCCPLAVFGYSRDRKRGYPQIEYGLLTDPHGRPVAVEVFGGNTADPTAFTAAVHKLRHRFALTGLTLVGDRGMITSARIAALKEVGGFDWVTALRAPDIAELAADTGPLQMSLFDQTNLAEIAHPKFPGERLIACRNPALAAERARKREQLLAATETDLDAVVTAVTAGRLTGADKIGMRVGRVIGKRKMAKHFVVTITDTGLSYRRDTAAITAETALDGIYVIRTSLPADQADAPAVVHLYKSLSLVERDFRGLKTIDLDLRPIRHYTETRVRGHVFLCVLANYLVWHLRRAWAALTFTDEQPPTDADPVAPARRSATADRKVSRRTRDDGQPLHTFRGLLDHLATLTRNTLNFPTAPGTPHIDQLATPTPDQRAAFQLLDQPIPLTLT
jgi:hypothetical protein